MKETIAFTIKFKCPSNATIGDCIEYIKTALIAECGSRNPDTDPMFYFDRDSLTVTKNKGE